MHRFGLDPGFFSLLPSLDALARDAGLPMNSDGAEQHALEAFTAALKSQRSNPARVFGFRTAYMFAHVVMAMGECQLCVEEDAGVGISSLPSLKRPDFRLVTNSGQQLLVEVKNYCPSKSKAPYRFKREYIESLARYGQVMSTPVKLAVHWTRRDVWTLTDVEALLKTNWKSLPFFEAIKASEMSLLGDVILATVPPLTMRLHAVPTGDRRMKPEGVAITIQRVSFWAAGEEILDPFEQKLAFFLMLNCTWEEISPYHEENGEIIHVDFVYEPQERVGGEMPFENIGYLSQLISHQYRAATSNDDGPTSLMPGELTPTLGIAIPKEYECKTLKLWRFVQQPGSFET
jgi:hypothetical protein